jgi:hypothetical protein
VDRFVVGTGRCGSTLLSRMLALHRHTLSIFEFMNGIDAARRFDPAPVEGVDFASLISAEQPFVTAVLRRGYDVSEIVYPFEEDGRYQRDEALPWILVSVLPRLSDDPDSLFDAVMEFSRELPRQPMASHYRALFDWLAERLGRSLWIERSGSSIEYLASLCDSFPDARFLHLHRDGPETALSMREHHAYRLPISILYEAPVASGKTLAELGALDLQATPTCSDPISQILASRPCAHYFGRYWNDQVLRGYRALPRLDPDRYCEVRFEDLLERPGEVLGGIGAFFGLDADPGWVARAAALVEGVPARRVPELASEEREALAAACRPGQQLLGRAP